MLRPVLTLALLLGTGAASGDGDAPARPPVPETTEVHGAVPRDIVGRWLVVSQITLPNDGKVRPAARTWEIRPGAEHMELVLGRGPLPAAIAAKVNAAGAAGTGWTPDADDLRQVNASWDGTSPLERSYTKVESKLFAADGYPAEFRTDETTKDAPLAITVEENFVGQGVAKTYSVYGIRERTPSTLRGKFVTTSLAISIVPIPITLKGDVTAYRLDAAPSSPWWQRLFAGCRRD